MGSVSQTFDFGYVKLGSLQKFIFWNANVKQNISTNTRRRILTTQLSSTYTPEEK